MQKGTKIFLTMLTVAVIGGLWLTWKHASAAAKRADDLEKQVEALWYNWDRAANGGISRRSTLTWRVPETGPAD